MIDWADIYAIVTERRRHYTPILQHMQEVTSRYDGEYVIPLPGGEDAKKLPQLAPSIIAETVDHMAMHGGSQLPTNFCPPSNGTSKRSVERAGRRKKGLDGVWEENYMPLLLRKGIRQMTGYSTFNALVWPDSKTMRPRIELRDPLGALPEEVPAGTFDPPNNCAYVHPRSAQWVLDRWAKAHMNNGGVISDSDVKGNEMFDIVEWWDADQCTFGIYGRRPKYQHVQSPQPHGGHMHLVTFDNKAGVCPVVTPHRISLADISSQVASILGQVDLTGYMAALDLLASQKLMYPDRVIIGRSGQMPKLVNEGGRWYDGTEGKPNIVLNADRIETLPGTVDPSGKIAADRVERNVRNAVGLIPQFGGETYGSLRTGRAIDTLGSFSIDARIEEIHAILETGLEQLNGHVQDTLLGYYGSKTFTYFTGYEGDDSYVEFTPNDDIENTANSVRYAIRGLDTASLTAQLSQMLAVNAIDLRTYRRMHPHIHDDGAAIERSTYVADMEELGMVQLQQAMGEGAIIAEDLQAGVKAVMAGKSRLDAITAIFSAADKRAEAAAAEAAQALPEGAPLTTPGAPSPGGPPPGAPQGAPPIGPNPDQRGLFQLIGATQAGLRR